MSLYIREEATEHVAAALGVCQSDEERKIFLRCWFQGAKARCIAANPMLRGRFARAAGMTPKELGLWNRFQAGIV